MDGLGRTDKIYFLKASNTQDFYIYTPDSGIGTWISDTMPLGIRDDGDGKKPKRGAAMRGLNRERALFVLRGNNTVGFWKYQADTLDDTILPGWYKLANIPLGAKKCKYGTGLAPYRRGGNNYIFTMKGAKTDEFYIYSIAGDSWSRIISPPIGRSGKYGYKKGSCVAYDGNEFVYVLQGYYGTFMKYSTRGDSWHELRQYDYKLFLNRDGKKKKPKDGAALEFYQDNVYLLKGGNTNEFWKYEIATDTWIQMGPAEIWDIPLGLSNKKVKDGGALTIFNGYFYASKGKNTNEFYRHILPDTSTFKSIRPITNQIIGGNQKPSAFSVTIVPNPAINATAVRFSLPKAEPVSFKIFDITGSMKKSYTNTNPTKEGVFLVNELPAGVYILRFDSGNIRVTKKLVLQK